MSARRARRPRLTARERQIIAEWEKVRPMPLVGSRRVPDPIPNMLATAEGCTEMARMILTNYATLPQRGRRQLALDILENAIDYGFVPPVEILTILKRELAIAARASGKPEFWQAVEIKRAEPDISIRDLAKRVGVPWPTIGRWQRSDYWKVAVSLK